MLVLVDIKYASKATQCIRSDHRDQLYVFQCYSYSLIADYFTDLHKANQLPVVYFKVTDDVSTTSRRFSLYNKNSFYCKGVPVYLSTPCCGHMLVALFFFLSHLHTAVSFFDQPGLSFLSATNEALNILIQASLLSLASRLLLNVSRRPTYITAGTFLDL